MKHDRPPQARSTATREKLIEAALDTIHEVGLKKASTPEFSKAAGVSRGALLHHFPTRADIVIAAMEKLLSDGRRDIRAVAAEVSQHELGLDELIEFLWGMFSSRFFYLSVEFINEARTDPELREKMLPVVRHFHEALDEIWRDYYAPPDGTAREAKIVLNLTLCLIRGMGVQTVLKDDPEYFRTLLETWKTILPQIASRGLARAP